MTVRFSGRSGRPDASDQLAVLQQPFRAREEEPRSSNVGKLLMVKVPSGIL